MNEEYLPVSKKKNEMKSKKRRERNALFNNR
jgi:hypothetical protein